MRAVLPSVLCCAILTGATSASDSRRPPLSLEEALGVAKTYARQQKLDLGRHYLDSIRLDLNPRGDRGQFWLLTYELEHFAKGGQIFLRVYMNRQVEKTYGE